LGGKAAAGAVILVGAAHFVLSGLYELTGSGGVEHAAGIVGLVFVAVAGYVGLATLLEPQTRIARSCRSGAAGRRERRSTRGTGRSSATRSSARPACASSSSPAAARTGARGR
jgi:hypothetical protein